MSLFFAIIFSRNLLCEIRWSCLIAKNSWIDIMNPFVNHVFIALLEKQLMRCACIIWSNWHLSLCHPRLVWIRWRRLCTISQFKVSEWWLLLGHILSLYRSLLNLEISKWTTFTSTYIVGLSWQRFCLFLFWLNILLHRESFTKQWWLFHKFWFCLLRLTFLNLLNHFEWSKRWLLFSFLFWRSNLAIQCWVDSISLLYLHLIILRLHWSLYKMFHCTLQGWIKLFNNELFLFIT